MKKIAEIKDFSFKNGKEIIKFVKTKNIILSPWIENIFKGKRFTNHNRTYSLYLINLKRDIGIKKTTILIEIYKKLKNQNYDLVPPEICLYASTKISIKKKGTWYRFATPLKSMIDSDKVPHLPKFGYALKKKFVETYWSYPKAMFHPHNDFIVCKKK